MSENKTIIMEHTDEQLALPKYIIGYVGSIAITLLAYVVVVHGTLNHAGIETLLSALAVSQFVLQMVFFLHIGTERKPRWKLGIMFLMLMVVSILVGGSLWIMNNLNYRMTPQQMQQYLNKEDAF